MLFSPQISHCTLPQFENLMSSVGNDLRWQILAILRAGVGARRPPALLCLHVKGDNTRAYRQNRTLHCTIRAQSIRDTL